MSAAEEGALWRMKLTDINYHVNTISEIISYDGNGIILRMFKWVVIDKPGEIRDHESNM